jgi:hypothetical protein
LRTYVLPILLAPVGVVILYLFVDGVFVNSGQYELWPLIPASLPLFVAALWIYDRTGSLWRALLAPVLGIALAVAFFFLLLLIALAAADGIT